MCRIALAALLVTSAAAAKTDLEPGDDERGEYDPVAIRATLDGISARLVVDYRITTPDTDDVSPTSLHLALPDGAVVTGATITHAGIARRMKLDTVEMVEKQFEDVFGGDAPERKPTMWIAKIAMSRDYDSRTSVDVTIAAPVRTQIGLSLEIAAQTCFSGDKRYVRLPSGWEHAARTKPPRAAVIDRCVHPESVSESDAWIAFPAPQAARRASGDRFYATTARLAIDHDLNLARTELALAETLADLPNDLATVILVDESRSMTHDQRRSQREIVLGYLRAAPNSRVQVLAFSRSVRPLLPAWTSASRAGPRLQRELASLSPRNGSNFDLGLVEAGRILAATTGTRRVLLVTDDAMASRLAKNPEQLVSHVPAGTIINVAVTTNVGDIDDEGNPILARHDDARLAQLAASTTGIASSLGEIDSSRRLAIDAAMLVRPTSLDHVRTTGLGWTDLDTAERERLAGQTCADSIAAGASCVWWTRGTRFAGPIQLEGLLWNQRVVRLVRPLADPGHTIAREIAGSGTTISADENPQTTDGEADERLAKRLDSLAHAVTSSTSLVVRWGGDVPFSSGIIYGGLGGFGRAGTIGTGHSIGIPGVRVDVVDLGPQLRPLVAHCKLDGKRAVVTLELTFHEIVDVDVVVSPAPGDLGDTQRRCIEEAAWDFTPTLPSIEPLRTARVTL
ncbi:MAG: vWA domain-containing protein [Kofleriaceae bacterium]